MAGNRPPGRGERDERTGLVPSLALEGFQHLQAPGRCMGTEPVTAAVAARSFKTMRIMAG